MAASVEKVSVAIAHEELAWAREQAEQRGTSLSAVLTEALRRARQREAWAAFCADVYPDGFTDEELAAAEREWRG